jgi:WD40 repeat protein
MAFTPDGHQIVVGGDDAIVRVICLQDDKRVELYGHSKPIYAVVVTSDGRFAITGSEDMTIRLWDLYLEKCIQSFSWHQGIVLALSLSRDDRRLLSGGSDRTTKAFELDWDYQF